MPNILIIGLDYGPIIFLRCQKGKIYPNIATSTNVIHHIRCTKSSARYFFVCFTLMLRAEWKCIQHLIIWHRYVFLLTAFFIMSNVWLFNCYICMFVLLIMYCFEKMYDVFPTIKLIYGCKQFIFKWRFCIWVRQMYECMTL